MSSYDRPGLGFRSPCVVLQGSGGAGTAAISVRDLRGVRDHY